MRKSDKGGGWRTQKGSIQGWGCAGWRTMQRIPFLRVLAGMVLVVALGWGGCATPRAHPHTLAAELRVNSRGEIAGTGFVAMDLVVGCAELQRALGEVVEIGHRGRKAGIVVEPVKNDTPFTLDMDTFNGALFDQLAHHAGADWEFLAHHRPPAETAGYFLVGRLQHLRSLQSEVYATLLYSFQLIDARNSEIVLAGTAELKNQIFPAAAADATVSP